jgi:hypothetical protein
MAEKEGRRYLVAIEIDRRSAHRLTSPGLTCDEVG